DAIGDVVATGNRVLGVALRLQHDPRIEMQDAISAKARALGTDGHMSGPAAAEILCNGIFNARAHASAKRFAEVEILAGNAEIHLSLSVQLAMPEFCFSRRRCTD